MLVHLWWPENGKPFGVMFRVGLEAARLRARTAICTGIDSKYVSPSSIIRPAHIALDSVEYSQHLASADGHR